MGVMIIPTIRTTTMRMMSFYSTWHTSPKLIRLKHKKCMQPAQRQAIFVWVCIRVSETLLEKRRDLDFFRAFTGLLGGISLTSVPKPCGHPTPRKLLNCKKIRVRRRRQPNGEKLEALRHKNETFSQILREGGVASPTAPFGLSCHHTHGINAFFAFTNGRHSCLPD